MIENRAEVLQQTRDEIRAARRAAVAIVTPFLVDEFIQRLLRGPIVTRALEAVA